MPMPATVPPCSPTASTHPNRNIYAFICRLRVHGGGVASLTTGARAPGLGALPAPAKLPTKNNPLGPLGDFAGHPRSLLRPSTPLLALHRYYTRVRHAWLGPESPMGPRGRRLCGRVPLGPYETAGPARTDHPLGAKAPPAHTVVPPARVWGWDSFSGLASGLLHPHLLPTPPHPVVIPPWPFSWPTLPCGFCGPERHWEVAWVSDGQRLLTLGRW
jgi:hypothetical protein